MSKSVFGLNIFSIYAKCKLLELLLSDSFVLVKTLDGENVFSNAAFNPSIYSLIARALSISTLDWLIFNSSDRKCF